MEKVEFQNILFCLILYQFYWYLLFVFNILKQSKYCLISVLNVINNLNIVH